MGLTRRAHEKVDGFAPGRRIALVGNQAFAAINFRGLLMLGGEQPVMAGDWAIILTIFAAVSLLNGVNMIDGVDGLAGGFVFLALGIFVTTN